MQPSREDRFEHRYGFAEAPPRTASKERGLSSTNLVVLFAVIVGVAAVSQWKHAPREDDDPLFQRL